MEITVFIAEGNPVFTEGLAAKLKKEKGIILITKTDQQLSTLDFIVQHRPDIVITVIDHPGESDGFRLLRDIRRLCGDTVRVLAFSDSREPEIFGAFFHYGGMGYELKTCSEDEIAIAVRCVFRGNRFLCSALGGESVYFGYRKYPSPTPEKIKTLTPMQRKVLAIVQTGGTAKDVSCEIGMAVSTAEKHISRIMKKLEIPNQEVLRMSVWLSKLD